MSYHLGRFSEDSNWFTKEFEAESLPWHPKLLSAFLLIQSSVFLTIETRLRIKRMNSLT